MKYLTMGSFVIYLDECKYFIEFRNWFSEKYVELLLRVTGLLNQQYINFRSLYKIRKKLETF